MVIVLGQLVQYVFTKRNITLQCAAADVWGESGVFVVAAQSLCVCVCVLGQVH